MQSEENGVERQTGIVGGRYPLETIEFAKEGKTPSGKRGLKLHYPSDSLLLPSDIALLRRAAETARVLDHPGIAPIVSVEKGPAGLDVITRIPHAPTLLESGRDSSGSEISRIINIARSLLGALAYAHKQEILHGDVCPKNIYVDKNDNATIACFVFRSVARDLEILRGRLRYELMIYMAPEQLLGTSLFESTDIYSLGVVLYELTTGRAPFLMGDVATQHLKAKPRTPASLVSGIPLGLNELVMKCLAKDPEQRYQTAEDMLEALEELQRQIDEKTAEVAPIELEQETELISDYVPSDLVEPLERHEHKFVQPGEPGAQIKTEGSTQFTSEQSLNEQETAIIEGIARNAAPTSEALANMLTTTEDESEVEESRMTTALVDLSSEVRDSFEKGLAMHSERQYTQAIKHYTDAIGIDPGFAPAYNNRALGYYDMGEYNLAVQDYTRAIEADPKFADAYLGRGLAYYKNGQLELAVHDYTQAMESNPQEVAAYYNCGIAHYGLKMYEEAVAEYTEVIRLDPQHATAYYNRGIAQYKANNLSAAIQDFNKAIDLNREHHTAYYNRGSIYLRMKKYDEALNDLSKAIELQPDYAIAYYCRGNVYSKMLKFDEGIADYTEVLRLAPNSPQAYFSRGCLYGNTGEYLKAVRDFDQAVNLDPNYGPAYWNRAIAYEMLGYKKKARADFKKADDLNYKPE